MSTINFREDGEFGEGATLSTETVSGERLEPCPFCGSNDIDPEGWGTSGGICGPACNGCQASVGSALSSTADNISAWNRRALSPSHGEAVAFQDRVAEAHVALFHDDPTDLAERRDRFGEETNELQQALGQTREAAHQLVDYTYDRPVGEVGKEIGAAALTLASLCVIGGWDMMACAEADLAALQTPEKIAKVRAKRATRHGRGPLPGLSPDSLPLGGVKALDGIKRALGQAEWGSPKDAEAVLQEIIDEWHPKLSALKPIEPEGISEAARDVLPRAPAW